MTKQQQVYLEIKQAIINNEYKANEILTERFLCDKYNVSRTPVREALRQLSSEGMVNIIPGKGCFVSKISLEDIIEIFEMREALERQTIKLFILKDNDDLIEKLNDCFNSQMEFEDKDPYKFMQKDMEFHFIIAEGAKNDRLANALETIYDQIEMMAISAENDENLREMAKRHHLKILDAIVKGDIQAGEECIVDHILEIKNYHMCKHMISS